MGDNLVTADNPTGDKQSSAQVWRKYVNTNQNILTLPISEMLMPNTKDPNPSPTSSKAIENLTAVLGLYFPNFTQSQAKTGANKTIKRAFKLKKLPAGMTPRSKILSAKRFKEVYACSNKAQKITVKIIKIVRENKRSLAILSNCVRA